MKKIIFCFLITTLCYSQDAVIRKNFFYLQQDTIKAVFPFILGGAFGGSIDASQIQNVPNGLLRGSGGAFTGSAVVNLSSEVTDTLLITRVKGLLDSLGKKSDTSHTHPISKIVGLQDTLNKKSDTSHTHTISKIIGLQDSLNKKSDTAHIHTILQVTGLVDSLGKKADTTVLQNYFKQGGNSFGDTACLGSNDTNLVLKAYGLNKVSIDNDGNFNFLHSPPVMGNAPVNLNLYGNNDYLSFRFYNNFVEVGRTEVDQNGDYYTWYLPNGVGTAAYISKEGIVTGRTGFSINGSAPTGSFLKSNGTAYDIGYIDSSDIPVDYSPHKLSSITGINAKTVATTNLYTVPIGKIAIITEAIVYVTSASAITIPPTLGIGIAAGEDDIYSSVQLVGLNATNKMYRFSSTGTYVIGQATEVIKLGIDIGATATTMIVTVDLIGYLK